MKQTKAERILALLEKGYSINIIAHRVQCTTRYVYMLNSQRKKAKELAAAQLKAAQLEQANKPVSLFQRIKNFFKGLV
jgi:hypothetical protein